ncbi:hypothetical protein RUE5091_01315 [Ruegeria denitrificans]|uniref:Glycosyl transferases group 1 n=1 Tax=Ruegeria denitrificans TaxID=1715692 RepID=A0A0P1IE26_9RHOB|nr:hypothetical protein [Ruegeria denitrificans]CUJ93260.1 hypothetical protein RUE5091_01315 [Ruegeria denitrificans]
MTVFNAITCADMPKIAYVIEPRFSGGTSAAVAAELRAIADFGQLEVHAVTSRTFGENRHIAPVLRRALDDLHIPLIWDAPRVCADFVILHNPSFLKFNDVLSTKIFAQDLIVVTHENFLRPGGEEGFDVTACLNQIEASSLALRRTLAPISPYNRRTVTDWLSSTRVARQWRVFDQDWFNICQTEVEPPCESPRDRRGRHSRPGFEKFPSMSDLDRCFPKSSESNVILGADALLSAGVLRAHWTLLPFDAINVDEFFGMIDFYVYFTAPTWQESFGRVVAEALAAGKVVLTNPATGATFGDAVLTCDPGDVDGIISDLVAEPQRYHEQVSKSQAVLDRYSVKSFKAMLSKIMTVDSGVLR